MKTFLTFVFAVLCAAGISAQAKNPKYDSTLAKKLGADEYGMKMYTFVILKGGDNKSEDKAYKDSCFTGHMANINRLVKEGKLVVAGPFGKNENGLRGLFILNTGSAEEAKKMLDTDPAIKADFLKAELYPWYGSAALPEYLEASEKVRKSKF